MIKVLICIWAFLAPLGVMDTWAEQDTQTAAPQASGPKHYPVMLGEKTLFHISKDVYGLSAKERAKIISTRLKKIADTPDISVDSLQSSDFDLPVTLLTAGDKLVFAVADADIAGKDFSRHELAAEYGKIARNAIIEYRQERRLRQVLTGAALLAGYTVLVVLVLYLFAWLYRKINQKITFWIESQKASLKIQGTELVRAEDIGKFLFGMLKLLRFFAVLFVLYFYVQRGLSEFVWTRTLADRLMSFILAPLQTMGNAFLDNLPNFFFLGIWALVVVGLLRLMRLFFSAVEAGTIKIKNFYPEWAQPTLKIARIMTLALAVVVAYPYIPGSDSLAFKGVSIFLGVLFSFGSTSAISNILAGYMITYRRIFKIGDRIQIGEFVGDVIETRLQVVHLRTVKNEEIIVPTSVIVNSNVINYTSQAQQHGLIVHSTVTIGYDTPWRQVHAMLLMAAERTRGFLPQPKPFVLQKSLGDFYVAYELNGYIDNPKIMPRLYSELHQNIQDVFNEYGVQIMSPNYVADRSQPAIVSREHWFAPPAQPPADG